MDNNTRQFMYRWVVRTVCGVVAAVVLAQLVSIFYFGDGEGIRIIDELRPLLMETIAGMLGVLGLNRVMESHDAANGASSPDAAPALPVPATPPDVRADGTVVGNG